MYVTHQGHADRAIVADAGTSAAGLTGVTTAILAPAMAVIGLGMGAAFGTLYDIAIGDIDPAEAGSASGSLSSVQQLANALGPAIVTSIYFGALTGGQAHAMTVSLLAVIGIGVASALAVPLLPRKPQADAGH